MTKNVNTRERIMDIAQEGILAKGFGSTSIEEIIAEAAITKSGFFYHFKDKNALARALLQRHLDTEEDILDDVFGRAKELHDDPLHAFLIGLKLLAELLDDMKNGHPGCLVATICYSERMFDDDVRRLNREGVLEWRRRFRKTIDEIAEIYPPRDPVDFDALADMISNAVEGAIVMSRALNEPEVLGQQVMLLRSYIKLLFLPAANRDGLSS